MDLKTPTNKHLLRFFLVYAIPFIVALIAGIIIYRSCIFAPYDYVFDYIGSDSVRQLYPSYYWLYETLFEDVPSLWSLNMGLGTSVFSHSEIVLNPLTYILYLGGKANIGHMFVWLIIAGMCLSSISVNLWLGLFGLNELARIIAASCYTVSGWLVIMGSNVPWITAYIYFPLLLWSLDIFITKSKKLPLVLVSCATALYSFYFLWMFAIAGLVYAIMRICWHEGGWISVKHALLGVFLFLFGALLGAVWLLPSIDAVLQGSRLGSSLNLLTLFNPSFKAFTTGFSRLLGIDFLGSVSNYSGSMDFFNLSTYSAFIPIVAISQLLALSNSKLKKRTLFVIALCVLTILFPIVSWLFNGFSDISYRWLFVWLPIVSLGTAMGLSIAFRERKWSWKAIICVCALLVLVGLATIAILPPLGNDSAFGRVKRIAFALSMIILYSILFRALILSQHKQTPHIKSNRFENSAFIRASILIALSLLFFCEIGIMYRHWPDSRSYSEQFSNMVENKTGYFDSDFDAISGIRLLDDSFYRIEKAQGSVVVNQDIMYESDNDSMVQNYYGTHSYNSMNSSGAISFLQASGIFVAFPGLDTSAYQSPYELNGPHLNYINGVGDRYKLMALLGIKYYITSYELANLPNYFVLDSNLSSDSRLVWRNNAAYPFASFYDKAIPEYMPQIEVNKVMNHDLLEYATLQQDVLNVEMISEGDYFIEINAPNNGVLLVTTPYEKNNWLIEIDDNAVEPMKVDCGLLGIAVDSGWHQIRVSYSPRWFSIGLVISAVCLMGMIAFGVLHHWLSKIQSVSISKLKPTNPR